MIVALRVLCAALVCATLGAASVIFLSIDWTVFK